VIEAVEAGRVADDTEKCRVANLRDDIEVGWLKQRINAGREQQFDDVCAEAALASEAERVEEEAKVALLHRALQEIENSGSFECRAQIAALAIDIERELVRCAEIEEEQVEGFLRKGIVDRKKALPHHQELPKQARVAREGMVFNFAGLAAKSDSNDWDAIEWKDVPLAHLIHVKY
jgi:hypothetical protein